LRDAVRLEFFFVNVEARIGVAPEDSVCEPGFEGFARLPVGIFAFRQLQPDDVVRIFGKVRETLFFADDIIRRAGQLCDIPRLARVAQSAERFDFSHSVPPFLRALFLCAAPPRAEGRGRLKLLYRTRPAQATGLLKKVPGLARQPSGKSRLSLP
jgi:hypothetical protein